MENFCNETQNKGYVLDIYSGVDKQLIRKEPVERIVAKYGSLSGCICKLSQDNGSSDIMVETFSPNGSSYRRRGRKLIMSSEIMAKGLAGAPAPAPIQPFALAAPSPATATPAEAALQFQIQMLQREISKETARADREETDRKRLERENARLERENNTKDDKHNLELKANEISQQNSLNGFMQQNPQIMDVLTGIAAKLAGVEAEPPRAVSEQADSTLSEKQKDLVNFIKAQKDSVVDWFYLVVEKVSKDAEGALVKEINDLISDKEIIN